jgi:Activator of Hsp90 ATPase homolog 1-like protein
VKPVEPFRNGVKPLEPIRHALMIEADQDRTFHAFVRRLGAWWPIQERVVTPRKSGELRVEEWLGGRIYQVGDPDGEYDFGRVTLWKPPDAFSFTWAVSPGLEFTEVDLLFQRLGPALTRVVVAHHGWERLSSALLDSYTSHVGGWLGALRSFAAMFEVEPEAEPRSDDTEPDL